jgi:hypothetical protein
MAKNKIKSVGKLNNGDLILKWVGIVGGLLAAANIIFELYKGRIQNERDLRWSQAKTAHELILQLQRDELAGNAMIMFDWDGREYEIALNKRETISWDDLKIAIRTHSGEGYSGKEVFIRDCVDGFLFHVEFMEQSIDNGLIEFRDIKFPMEYYHRVLKDTGLLDPLKEYIRVYKYQNAEDFFNRFEDVDS